MKAYIIYVDYPCKGCTDRTIEPNCHSTCEKYLAAKEKNEQIQTNLKNQKRRSRRIYQWKKK